MNFLYLFLLGWFLISFPARADEFQIKLASRVRGTSFEVYDGKAWKPFYVKGVNLSTALPGKWFAEFPNDVETYLHWFDLMREMQSNLVRVYTLFPPQFYRALLQHNEKYKDRPLRLLQEIWPDETVAGNNFLNPEAVFSYRELTRSAVDAIHGNLTRVRPAFDFNPWEIPLSRAAGGKYDANVFPYLLGYLVGRELLPEEVLGTNAANPNFSFQGKYLKGIGASPTEAWMASTGDYLLTYEEKYYGVQAPVGFVSWPTLDPKEHDSEWNAAGDKKKEYNDCVSVDIDGHFGRGPRMRAGFFGAYHIYPNYPDFINNEPAYADYQDAQGTFRYGGYLNEFIRGHRHVPALVAEFGLATGMGTAHLSPEGYHHGGVSEELQASGTLRMLEAIQREGYAGAIVFEWMDEWAKKTWNTLPYMREFGRHAYWHNAVDPEQHYGILANDPLPPEKWDYEIKGSGPIRSLQMGANESFLFVLLTFDRKIDWKNERVELGLDTTNRNLGEFFYPGKVARAPSGMEFVATFEKPESADLRVLPSYDIAERRLVSTRQTDGIFRHIRPEISPQRITKDGKIIPAQYEAASSLRYGDDENAHWSVRENTLQVRLPWARLNISDPSRRSVLHDPKVYKERPGVNTVDITESDGIVATAILVSKKDNQVKGFIPGKSSLELPPEYLWPTWNMPRYRERLKKVYFALKKYWAVTSTNHARRSPNKSRPAHDFWSTGRNFRAR